eukprot:gene2169-4220_t
MNSRNHLTCALFALISSYSSAFFNVKLTPNAVKLSRFPISMADYDVDVAVIGGGIGGTTISWVLQNKEKCKVALIDPNANNANTSWYPNYGEWRDEWHVLSERLDLPELKDCTTNEWEHTDCFFGGSFDIPADERLTLPRPYVRVDRIKMQSLMRGRLAQAGGVAIAAKLPAKRISNNLFESGIVHDANGSLLTLDNGQTIRCKTVIDATGAESRLIAHEDPVLARGSPLELKPGYQIAYGFIAIVDSLGPYDPLAMTLFDYRTTHYSSQETLKQGEDKPTFMYTMPLSKLPNGNWRVFFEETSLVGRDSRRLSFNECKQRAFERLAYYNINVFGIEEEEYCYIPMGGELPDLTQRIVAFGAAANLVHPSTGYQACRMLASSTDVAAAIGKGIRDGKDPDHISLDAYRATWDAKKRLQRDFQIFGGEFLMAQNVKSLRGFFSAFFALSQPVWGGFLAGWPGLPGNENHDVWTARLSFALGLFVKMPTEVKLNIMLYAIKNSFEYGPNILLRSVTPPFLFGSGPSDPTYVSISSESSIGDMEVKDEARTMMKEFKPMAEEE